LLTRHALYGVIAGLQHPDTAAADRASRRARHRYSRRRRSPASGEPPYNGRQQHAPRGAVALAVWRPLRLATMVVRRGGVSTGGWVVVAAAADT